MRRFVFATAVASTVFASSCNDSNFVRTPKHQEQPCGARSGAATSPDAVPADGTALATAMDVPVAFTATLETTQKQAAAFAGLGTLVPMQGPTFAYLATGVAGAGTAKSLDPWATSTQNAEATNGPGCAASFDSFDCAELTLTFQVPADAQTLAFDFNFLSTEYPEFVGSSYNDMFHVAQSSPSHSFPNLVFDGNGAPVDVNNVFFVQPCGQLTGTGFDIYRLLAPTECDAGATGLLTTFTPVAGGETVTLTFSVWDQHDAWLDSGVMIDNVRFDAEPIETPYTATPTPTATPESTPPPTEDDPC